MGAVPLMIIPLILYVIAGLFFYDHANYIIETGELALHPFWDEAVADFTLVSGQYFPLTWGNLLIIFALLMLLFSMLISASSFATTVLGNMIIVIVLCAYIVMFLTLDFCGTTVFFILTMISLVDALSSIAISIVASHSRYDAVSD
jgi:hypothetical protein